MKKTHLRKIIRESIKELMEKELLTENINCQCSGGSCQCSCNPDNGCGTIIVSSCTRECRPHCDGSCGSIDPDNPTLRGPWTPNNVHVKGPEGTPYHKTRRF